MLTKKFLSSDLSRTNTCTYSMDAAGTPNYPVKSPIPLLNEPKSDAWVTKFKRLGVETALGQAAESLLLLYDSDTSGNPEVHRN